MWMDWVLSGHDYGDCFGTANHHMVDLVARTPYDALTDKDVGKIEWANAMYGRLFEKAESTMGSHPYLGNSETMTTADVPLAVELNRWNMCLHNWHARESLARPLTVPQLPRMNAWYTRLREHVDGRHFETAVVAHEAKHHALEPSSITGLFGQVKH